MWLPEYHILSRPESSDHASSLTLPPGLVKEAPMEADKLTTLLVHGPLVPMAKEAYL